MSSRCRLLSKICFSIQTKVTKPSKCGLLFCQHSTMGTCYSQNMKTTSQLILMAKLNLSTCCVCTFGRYNLNKPPSGQYSLISNRYYVSAPTPNPENENPEKKPSLYQRFKSMYRDYWYVLLPVHLVTSAVWFGGFYYLASSGVDIVAIMENLNVSEKFTNQLRNGHATTGYIAISYALYKVATPLRYTVTLGGTTVSINYLKKWGYIKPLPSKEQLKEMYQDRKEILKEKGQSIKDNVIQTFKPTENITSKVLFYELSLVKILQHKQFQAIGLTTGTQSFVRFYYLPKQKKDLIKERLKRYWQVVVPIHLITSLIWYAVFYYMAVSGMDIVAIMEYLHLNEKWIDVFRKGGHVKTAGNMAVAWALYHLAMPVRLLVTIGLTWITITIMRRMRIYKKKLK